MKPTTRRIGMSSMGAGVILGGVLAFLFATNRGRRTRDRMTVQRQEWQTQARQTKQELADRSEALGTSVKDRTDRVAATVKEQVQNVRDRANQAAETVTEEWQEVKNESQRATRQVQEDVLAEQQGLRQEMQQHVHQVKQQVFSPASTSFRDQSGGPGERSQDESSSRNHGEVLGWSPPYVIFKEMMNHATICDQC